jgi:LPPG:FO 2-phospho-L-lactate transferase
VGPPGGSIRAVASVPAVHSRHVKIVALAGGIGAARFLVGLVRAVDPASLVVVANTGDDVRLHGLHVSPDLDTITYTLGGGVDPEQGWGRAGETTAVSAELAERYGREPWFTLGDRDIATHLVRTEILTAGGTLSDATRTIAEAWDLPFALLPMTDAPVETRIRTADGRVLGFQRWWVGERAAPDVADVWLHGAEESRPAPGVLDAIGSADAVLLCPSNPVVSIGTILAVPGIRQALRERPVVGVSPIVGGRVVRGMADRLLPAVGAEVSAPGVAELYRDFLDVWVMDDADAALIPRLGARPYRLVTTRTIMDTPAVAEQLAGQVLALAAWRAGKGPAPGGLV